MGGRASEEIVGVGKNVFVNCDEMSLVVSVVDTQSVMVKIKAAASVRCQCLYLEPHLLDTRFPWLSCTCSSYHTARRHITEN